MSSARISLWTLSSVPFVMVLSNSMLIPVLPTMQKALRVTPFQVGLIITAFSVSAGLIIPLGGYLSDRIGRRAVIIPALFLFGLGGLLAGLAPLGLSAPFLAILGARVLQGIGGGGLYQVAMALTGDIFQSTQRSRALGLLEAANGVGKVAAPIIGAAVGLLTWFAPFYVYPALSWPAAVAVWILVREPGRPGTKPSLQKYAKELKDTLKERGVSLLSAFLAGMIVLFLLFGILSYYSDILESRWGIRGFNKGFVMAVPVLAMAATSYSTGVVLQAHLTRLAKPSIIAGLLISAAALSAGFFLEGAVPFAGAMAFLGLGSGLVLPALNNIVTGATGSSERGVVTSLYGTVRFFGAALGPPIAGRVAALGAGPVLLGNAVVAVIAAAVVFVFLKQAAVMATPKSGKA